MLILWTVSFTKVQHLCFSLAEKVASQVASSVLWYFKMRSMAHTVYNSWNECHSYWRRQVEETGLDFFGLNKTKLGRSTQFVQKVMLWKVMTREWWLSCTSTGNTSVLLVEMKIRSNGMLEKKIYHL